MLPLEPRSFGACPGLQFAPIASTGTQVQDGFEDSMVEGIARANIEHFKKLLAAEKDAGKRKALAQRLADEEARLAAALKRAKKKTK